MRKIFFILLLFCSLTTVAQQTPEQLGGTYYAYPSPKDIVVASAPKGYKLVYVSHYGRHGSRWVTNDARYEWVLKYFDDNKNLTRDGKKAKKILQKIYANAKGNGGLLTSVGERQHQGIARRMAIRFHSLFSDSVRIDAHASIVDRCKKSMEAFLPELRSKAPKATITSKADSAEMKWINYESSDEMLLKMETKAPLEISPKRFIANLFKDPSKVNEQSKLLSEMFVIASDVQDVDGLNVSLYPFFTDDEMQACYKQSCVKMWHQNGYDPANLGIPAQCAANLWGNIVTKADKAISEGKPAATLRFGHDTALYRLLSLLDAKTVAEGNGMNLYQIVPMAANLQMAFYKNDQDSVLVGFWLNEKRMLLSNAPDTLNLYSWSKLKSRLNHFLITQKWKDRTAAINTMVGTDYAVTKSVGLYGKGSEEHGQTLPAVLAPHGMNFWTPQTRATERKCIAPYYYRDKELQGFRASHWIVGGCTQDYGSFTLMPEMDTLRLNIEERATSFSHKDEISHPYYYAVELPKEHLMAEMTASVGGRAAIFRFTPEKDGVMHIVMNPNSDYNEGFIAVDTILNRVYGYNPVHRIYQGWGEKAGFNGWFVVEFQQPLSFKTNDRLLKTGVKDTTAFVSFNVKRGEPVLVRAATSFTSLDNATKNLRAEMPTWDFLGARLRLDSVWQRQLATIVVEDSNTAKVNEFYGALYRSSFLPHIMSDVDGSHPRFSKGSVVKGNDYYDDFSMWDIYRAQLPLLTIIEPQRMTDIMQSLVTKYEEGGWMPIFPCWNSYTAAMIGDHAATAIADAWIKGIRGFDIKKAYEGVRKNAFESPLTFEEYKNGMGRRALKSYLRYGYIPMEDSVMEAFHTKEQVSRTLEYAYDDYCAAQLAKAVGNDADYKELMRRSANWKNVFNPKTKWVDGKFATLKIKEKGRKNKEVGDGQWLGNKDFTHRVPFITEGTVMHYSFYVPQDIPGLMRAMGGKKMFIAKLDTLFGFQGSSEQPTGKNYYWHGNEPCHHIAYLYTLAGEPRKTQALISKILQTEYLDVPGGLSGNDDAGQMSAWYVFSSLGFYPVCPGKAEYVIGLPTFRKARIGKLTIETKNMSADNRFISKTLWNGEPYSMPTITHEMITRGGTLTFIMGK